MAVGILDMIDKLLRSTPMLDMLRMPGDVELFEVLCCFAFVIPLCLVVIVLCSPAFYDATF